jgi:hypothetical protein
MMKNVIVVIGAGSISCGYTTIHQKKMSSFQGVPVLKWYGLEHPGTVSIVNKFNLFDTSILLTLHILNYFRTNGTVKGINAISI